MQTTKNKKRIYLDYASCAPELLAVRRFVAKLTGTFANPSSIHVDGVRAKNILEEARAYTAMALSAHADEIVFVGSGTESDNLAIRGTVIAAKKERACALSDLHIITTVIEHPAVLETCRMLERDGVQVTYLSTDMQGLIDVRELGKALRPETVLVSIAYVNNEIGVIQPIKEIAKEIRRYRKQQNVQERYLLLHTDACQAGLYLSLNVDHLGVDLLSLNGTKIGGPRGTGLLYLRRGTKLEPIIFGGGQESGLRSGTPDVVGIAGFALSLENAQQNVASVSLRVSVLRDFFISELKKKFPASRINGSTEARIPNNVSVSFPDFTSELLVLELDAMGISASAGSACSSAQETGSHVLEALYGKDDEKKWGTVRFSFGKDTSKRDIATTIKSIQAIFLKYEPWKNT